MPRWSGRGSNLAINRRRLLFESLEDRRLLTSEIEPNYSPGTATLISAAVDALQGEIADPADVDYFKVALAYGDRLIIKKGISGTPDSPGYFVPAIEILSPSGQTIAHSQDGRGISALVPATGEYYLKLTSQHVAGTFAGSYDISIDSSSFTGVSESESNDMFSTADVLIAGQNLRGSLSGADADFFTFSVGSGESISVKFANQWSDAPSVRLYDTNHNLIVTERSGIGFHADLMESGAYTLQFGRDNLAGSFTGQYVAMVERSVNPIQEIETGLMFEDAADWSVTTVASQTIGTISDLNDVDVFAVEFAPMTYYEFRLQSPTGGLGSQQRMISLYNSRGQLLRYSTSGNLSTGDFVSTPYEIGTHFVTVHAYDSSGLGGYALRGYADHEYPLQRDVSLFYHDYTELENHGHVRENSFDNEQAIPLLVGMADAFFDQYQVDVTLTTPSATNPHVSFAIGDYVDASGGFGTLGSTAGRSLSESAICEVTGEESWDSLVDASDWATHCVRHELGHTVGLQHAKHPLSVMSYDTQSDTSPVGSYFAQRPDARFPQTQLQNERNQMDWILQAGHYVGESEPNDESTMAQSFDPFLAAMRNDSDARNDRVIFVGNLHAGDVDYYSLTAAANEIVRFDVDAAEFQSPLDSVLRIHDTSGKILATSWRSTDPDSGLDSNDPYLEYRFARAGTYYVSIAAEFNTTGDYRLKAVPVTALDTDAPRIIAVWPEGGSVVDATRQLTFWLDKQLDSTTVAGNISVVGTTGERFGSATFDPMDATLVWTADVTLPPDTYTVTLKSNVSGIRDLAGNRLDGETDGSLHFPEISGNGVAGGDFVTSFLVSATDNSPATVNSTSYRRHSTNRGYFELRLDDELDAAQVVQTPWVLRGAGPDGWLDTADDTLKSLDTLYDKIESTERPTLRLYSRGVPDTFPLPAPDVTTGAPLGQ